VSGHTLSVFCLMLVGLGAGVLLFMNGLLVVMVVVVGLHF
jgi:hypothetical protein